MDRPERFCRSPEDFELVAAEWMRYWGFEGAERTPTGPDGGIDVLAKGAVAQVKSWMVPIGLAEVQQLRGAGHDGRQAIFFSLTGYTTAAIRFADVAQVALFRFAGLDGSLEPINDHASRIVENVTRLKEVSIAPRKQRPQRSIDLAGAERQFRAAASRLSKAESLGERRETWAATQVLLRAARRRLDAVAAELADARRLGSPSEIRRAKGKHTRALNDLRDVAKSAENQVRRKWD